MPDRGIEPVAISGSEVSRLLSDDGSVESYECIAEASDARVTGTAVATVVLEHEPPTKMSGTYELVNDGGSWVGDWVGEITESGNHIMEGVLEGTGDYEGLQYQVRWEGDGDPYVISGTIRASG